jgi:hypothetical protein
VRGRSQRRFGRLTEFLYQLAVQSEEISFEVLLDERQPVALPTTDVVLLFFGCGLASIPVLEDGFDPPRRRTLLDPGEDRSSLTRVQQSESLV